MIRSFKALFSLAVLFAALWFLDWKGLGETFMQLKVSTLIGAFALCVLQFVPVTWRWVLLAGGLCSRSRRDLIRDQLLSGIYNMITPANLGGDASRVMALRADAGGALPALLAVAGERVLGLSSFLSAFLLSFALARLEGRATDPLFSWVATASAGALSGLWLTLRFGQSLFRLLPDRWGTFLDAASRMFSAISSKIFGLFGLSLMAVGFWILCMGTIASGLGATISWGEIGMVVTLVELIRFVPVSVQGIGVREASFASIFGLYGLLPEQGFMVGAVGYVLLSLSLLFTGGLGLAMNPIGAATAVSGKETR